MAQQGVQVTGDEQLDLQSYLRSQVDALLQEKGLGGQEKAPEVKKYPVNLGGKVLEFDTPEAMQQAFENFGTHAAQEYQTALQQSQKQPNVTAPVVDQKPSRKVPKLDKNQFVDEFVNDPASGLTSYMEAYEQAKYGGPVDQVLGAMAQKLQGMERAFVADNFVRSHPDFPVKDANAAQVLGGIIEHNQLPYTPQSLDMAYNYAKTNGWIRPVEAQGDISQKQGQVQNQAIDPFAQIRNQQAPIQAPPQVGRGTNAPSGALDDMNKFASLSKDQMKRVLENMPPI